MLESSSTALELRSTLDLSTSRELARSSMDKPSIWGLRVSNRLARRDASPPLYGALRVQ